MMPFFSPSGEVGDLYKASRQGDKEPFISHMVIRTGVEKCRFPHTAPFFPLNGTQAQAK